MFFPQLVLSSETERSHYCIELGASLSICVYVKGLTLQLFNTLTITY